MPILIELEPFGKPEAGRDRLNTAMQQARSRNIRSHPVLEWAGRRHAGGPLLLFDLRVVAERMRWLAGSAGAHAVTPLLAVKSCTGQACLEQAQQFLSGYDVSNLNEYSLLPASLQDKLVSLTSPVLTDELEAFSARGNELVVSLDSRVQIEQYFARPRTIPYLLRVRGPDLLRGMQPPDPAFYPVTRFGLGLAELPELLQDPRLRANPPSGFHVHHGSEINRQSTFRSLISGLSELVRTLGMQPRYMNIGGGWHRLARPGIAAVLAEARRSFPLPCRILVEPGRWYNGPDGHAIGTVENLSLHDRILRVTLNLSARCHLHWSTPRLLHFTEPRHDQGCIVQFYGASCYESDLIGKYYLPCSGDVAMDTGLTRGARVVFGNVSTYSAEWNTSFNGIPEAGVEWMGE
jgi:diaminopimelate decarboxylase